MTHNYYLVHNYNYAILFSVKQSSFYFTPIFLSNDCLFTCECLSNGSLDIDSCNVLYTTDSMYRDPTMIVSPLNTQFEIAEITTDRVYYFEFSTSVNVTLLVRNRLTEKAISSEYISHNYRRLQTLTNLCFQVRGSVQWL